MESEKIGVTAVSELKTTGRKLYFSLEKKVAEVYDLRIGDTLKVQIVSVFRKPKEEE